MLDTPAAGLDVGALEQLATARLEIAHGGQVPTPSRAVARLSFGFWVSLVGGGRRQGEAGRRANYELMLWLALRGPFPHRRTLTRIEAHQPLSSLRKLRNRLAHHEPIFARPLVEDHACIL